MKLNTIRFKASILYSTILAIILILFAGVIYTYLSTILHNNIDHNLELKAKEIVTILEEYEKITKDHPQPLEVLLRMLEENGLIDDRRMIIDDLWRSKFEILNLKEDFINIVNVNGRTLLYSYNFREDVAKLFEKQFPVSPVKTRFATLNGNGLKLRAINLPVAYHDKQLVIQLATPLKKVLGILNGMAVLLAVSIIALLLVTSFLGGIFAERALLPVKKATLVANHIIRHKDLSVRVEEQQADEEMQELVKSFNSMISQLETSFQHITEFSSHVAHELKTPLAIIKGELELALEQERSTDDYKSVLRNCLHEIDRMIRVIKDLLLLAKLDYKREIFRFEPFVVNRFLEEIHEQSSILAAEKDITIELDLPASDITINADKVHLRRLFLNLINNAIQHTPRKGKITIKAAVEPPRVLISITDNGIGIAEENLEKIFQKFFRVQSEGTDKEAGTGLGLNIAQSIARAHHGTITVKSQLGQGSTFTVSLPVLSTSRP